MSTAPAGQGRAETVVVAVVAALAGVALAIVVVIGDVSPTGGNVGDVVAAVLLGAFVAWLGALAPWWALSGIGAVGALGCGLSGWLVPGLLAAGCGLLVGARRTRSPGLRAAAAGMALTALMHVRFDPVFGASAALVGAVTIAFCVVGLRQRERSVRRRVMWGTGGVFALAILASVGFGVGAVQARDALESANRHLADGLDELRAGETTRAAASLRAAAADFDIADGSVDAVYTRAAALVPVVAQHRHALARLVDDAGDSAAAAATALDAADLDQLTVVNGKIQVEALAALSPPLRDLDTAVARIAATISDANSPWLVGAVQRALAEAADEIVRVQVQSAATAAAAEHGPAMLGSDGPRRYLVAFTSPGEARGQSGLMGNWAEITITAGQIRQTGFGRTAQLIDALRADSPVLTVAEEYFDRYGPFGAGGPTAPVAPKYWSNVTMSPDAPTVASVMAQMYTAGGFGTLDGVFVLDPNALSALLDVTGPITVAAIDQQLSAENLQQFLLRDQYLLDEFTRSDALEAIASVTLNEFLTTTLPPAQQLAGALGPAATEGHIVGWAVRPEENEVFRLIGMSGALPAPAGRDGLAVVNNNAGGNKIDSFLERSTEYRATYNPSTGVVDSEVDITLRNTAPATGFPDYVIGNIVGQPRGTNRSLLTVYTPLGITAATVDGLDVGVTSGTERGWNTVTLVIDLAPGQERVVHLALRGEVADDGYAFVWRPQPLARPDTVTIAVTDTAGTSLAAADGVVDRISVIDSDGVRPAR